MFDGNERKCATMYGVNLWRALLILAVASLSAGCDLWSTPADRMARAETFFSQANYRAATIELKNVLAEQPANAAALLLMSRISLQLGDPDAADRYLRAALKTDSRLRSPQTDVLSADIWLALDQFDELAAAIQSGRLVLTEPARSVYLGFANLGAGKLDEAASAFKHAVQFNTDCVDATVGLAQVFAVRGDEEAALRLLAPITTKHTDAADAWRVQGLIFGRRADFAEMERSLWQAKRSAVGNLTLRRQAAIWTPLIEVELTLGKFDEASRIQAELAQAFPAALLTQYMYGRIAMARQDYANAVGSLQRLVAASPQFLPARFLLGAALLAQGNLNQAESILSQVVQQSPENLEARKLLAQARLRLDRPDAAIAALTPASSQDSGDAQLDALLGVAEMRAGDEAAAVAYLERSLAASPRNKELRLSLAAAYLRSGDANRAIELLQSPNVDEADVQREALLLLAIMSKGGASAALSQVERLILKHPTDSGMLNLAASVFIQQREYERARSILARSLAAHPDDVATLISMARLENAAGDARKSAGLFKQTLAKDPANSFARFGLAELALQQDNTAEAERWLEELRHTDAKAIDARLLLARLYIRDHQTALSDRLVAEVTELAADRADVLNAVGIMFFDASLYDQALGRFGAASKLEPKNAAYWLNVGRAQLALNQTDAAFSSVRTALKLRPDWLSAIAAMALLEIRNGRSNEAIERVMAAQRSHPTDAGFRVLEGDVRTVLKQYPQAALAYDAAAALRPDSATALKAFRVRELGFLPRALKPLEDWLAQHPEDSMVRAVLAAAYRDAGQTVKSIRQYETIVAAGPPQPAALNNLAWLYHQVGDRRALETAKKAYVSAPGIPSIADTYGWILVESGQIREGMEILEKAASAAGRADSAEIQYHLAVALSRNGNSLRALAMLNQLLASPSKFDNRGDAQRLRDSLVKAGNAGG